MNGIKMKKYINILNILLLLFLIVSISDAYMFIGGKQSGSTDCSVCSGTYEFCYTADETTDTDACINSGTLNAVDSDTSSDISTSYDNPDGSAGKGVFFTSDGLYMQWGDNDIVDLDGATQGTMWFPIWVPSGGFANETTVFAISETSTCSTGPNAIFRIRENGVDYVRARWNDGTNNQTIGVSGLGITQNRWNVIGYSWDTTNNVHCMVICDGTGNTNCTSIDYEGTVYSVSYGDGNWTCQEEAIDPMGAETDYVSLGTCDGGSDTEDRYADDAYVVTGSFQASFPW